MSQISKGETFADSQQLTATRLNNLVDSATLQAGAIHSQTLLSGTVNGADELLIYDDSTSSLRKTTVSAVLDSNKDPVFDSVTTSEINAKPASDVLLTPNDATIVSGKAFTSVDGITAVVTSTAHELQSGMLLEFTASNVAYSGQYFITVLSVDTFSYVIRQTTPVAASGTLSYTKKASARIAGGQSISSQLSVSGRTIIGGELTANGNIFSSGNNTFTGDNNFTGTLKINGNTCYILTEIFEEIIPPWSAAVAGQYNSVYTSSSFTKPAGEIWVFEVFIMHSGAKGHYEFAGRYGSTTYQTGEYLFCEKAFDANNVGNITTSFLNLRWIAPSATTFTSETLKIDAYAAAGTSSLMKMFQTTGLTSFISTSGMMCASSKFRIYKYKTA